MQHSQLFKIVKATAFAGFHKPALSMYKRTLRLCSSFFAVS
jgi:hypothetical protein